MSGSDSDSSSNPLSSDITITSSSGSPVFFTHDIGFPQDVPLLRSCECCRRKKRRCSSNKPICNRCKAQGETCVYRPTARFFKPSRSHDGSSHCRKRSSIASSSAGNSHTRTLSKSRSRESISSTTSSNRPRALSAMDALIKIQADAAVHSQQQRQSLNPMSLAPADLMLGTQMSPRSPGSQVLFGSQQQMQESQDLPFGRLSTPGDLAMAVGAGSALNSASADGLAYMAGLAAATMPVATGDDVTGATTQAQQQPLPLSISLPGTAASTPQMILNGHDLDFVASLAPSAAMMLTPASAPLASASAMSLSPSLLYSDAEYSQMVLANALSAQQLAVNAAAGASMYSPPLSTTSFGVAPGVMAVTPPQTDCGSYSFCGTAAAMQQQQQQAFSLWPPSATNGTVDGIMVGGNEQSLVPPVSVGMVTSSPATGLDCLSQSKSQYEWLF